MAESRPKRGKPLKRRKWKISKNFENSNFEEKGENEETICKLSCRFSRLLWSNEHQKQSEARSKNEKILKMTIKLQVYSWIINDISWIINEISLTGVGAAAYGGGSASGRGPAIARPISEKKSIKGLCTKYVRFLLVPYARTFHIWPKNTKTDQISRLIHQRFCLLHACVD